jgi:SHS2 domain-containing protein
MYRWMNHTSEVEIEIVSPTEAGVLEDAVRALRELIDDGLPAGAASPARAVRLELTARDRATLLAELMEEVLYRAEVDDLVPERLADVTLDDSSVRAELRGHEGRPSSPVKAVTFHRLTFEPVDGGWRATVVLDV